MLQVGSKVIQLSPKPHPLPTLVVPQHVMGSYSSIYNCIYKYCGSIQHEKLKLNCMHNYCSSTCNIKPTHGFTTTYSICRSFPAPKSKSFPKHGELHVSLITMLTPSELASFEG